MDDGCTNLDRIWKLFCVSCVSISFNVGICPRQGTAVFNIFRPCKDYQGTTCLCFAEFPSQSQVNPQYQVPIRSLGLVSLVVVILSLINIGSTTAFTAVLALSTLALYVSYLIPITLLLMKRLRGHGIGFGPFKLGIYGVPINLFAIIYGVFICIFLPFPPARPVTGANMNYVGPVFGLILVFAVSDWVLRGKSQFRGPLREVSENQI